MQIWKGISNNVLNKTRLQLHNCFDYFQVLLLQLLVVPHCTLKDEAQRITAACTYITGFCHCCNCSFGCSILHLHCSLLWPQCSEDYNNGYLLSPAIDPADPAVYRGTEKKSEHDIVSELPEVSDGQPPSIAVAVAKSFSHSETEGISALNGRTGSAEQANKVSCIAILGYWLCGWFIKGDSCHHEEDQREAFLCIICQVKVCERSRHCKSCDKCVAIFDHHCKWINNCVGMKNYFSFVALIITTLALLIFEWGVAIAVLVRCFIHEEEMKRQIADNLGDSFPRVVFIIILVLCALASMAPLFPLFELVMFHIILMRKGLTTYDYILAMRNQDEPQDDMLIGYQQVLESPSSTSTRNSKSSSVSLQYKGALCSPPRVVMDFKEDELTPHLSPDQIPSSVDPDASRPRPDHKPQKQSVRLSAIALAKLDRNEAARAAARAREKSSIMRPLRRQSGNLSSGDVSGRSSMSVEIARGKDLASERGQSSRISPHQAGRWYFSDRGRGLPRVTDNSARRSPLPRIRDILARRNFGSSSADNPPYQFQKKPPVQLSNNKSNPNVPRNKMPSVYFDPRVRHAPGPVPGNGEHGRGIGMSGSAQPAPIQSENLVYTEKSIFHSSPMIAPGVVYPKKDGSSGSNDVPGSQASLGNAAQENRSTFAVNDKPESSTSIPKSTQHGVSSSPPHDRHWPL